MKRLQRIIVTVAVERVRLAGAALIDEDDVAIVLHALEDRANSFCELRGALAGAAGQEEQRIRLRIGAQRRQHDDVQVDLASLLGRAILVDLERAAVGVDGRVVARARLEFVDCLNGLRLIAAADGEDGKNCDEHPALHRSDCSKGVRCESYNGYVGCNRVLATLAHGFQSGNRSLPGPVVSLVVARAVGAAMARSQSSPS